MFQIIALIIFLVSMLGIALILFAKIPVLAQLPENGHHGFKKHQAIIKLEKKIRDTHFHFFKKQMWLHKLLSLVKIWILKIETKIDHLLSGIRKQAQELDKQKKRRK